jgi:hypothetical protein
VTGRLRLGFEGVGGDFQPKVRLARGIASHGGVVCVKVGVVVDGEAGRGEGRGQLERVICDCSADGGSRRGEWKEIPLRVSRLRWESVIDLTSFS